MEDVAFCCVNDKVMVVVVLLAVAPMSVGVSMLFPFSGKAYPCCVSGRDPFVLVFTWFS